MNAFNCGHLETWLQRTVVHLVTCCLCEATLLFAICADARVSFCKNSSSQKTSNQDIKQQDKQKKLARVWGCICIQLKGVK